MSNRLLYPLKDEHSMKMIREFSKVWCDCKSQKEKNLFVLRVFLLITDNEFDGMLKFNIQVNEKDMLKDEYEIEKIVADHTLSFVSHLLKMTRKQKIEKKYDFCIEPHPELLMNMVSVFLT